MSDFKKDGSIDLSLITFSRNRPEEHIDFQASPVKEHKAPNCMEFVHLEYSPHAFEHLEVSTSLSYVSVMKEKVLENMLFSTCSKFITTSFEDQPSKDLCQGIHYLCRQVDYC